MSAGRLVVDGAGPVGRPRKTLCVSAGRLVVDGAGPVGRPMGRPRRPGVCLLVDWWWMWRVLSAGQGDLVCVCW